MKIVDVGNCSFNSFNNKSINKFESVKSETDLQADVPVDHLNDDDGLELPDEGILILIKSL